MAVLLMDGVGNDGCHHCSYKAQAHHDNNLFTVLACGCRKLLEPSIFDCVIFLGWQGKSFAGWTDGIFWHADPRVEFEADNRAEAINRLLEKLDARSIAPDCQ